MSAMHQVGMHTLILTTNITAAKQWKRELLDKTGIREADIGEYTGEIKEIRPITVATYQIITYRKKKSESFPHFSIFNDGNWGLIIYDEVHLLPAPVFRITAQIQARRRLGLGSGWILASFGLVTPEKRISMTLRCLKRLLDEGLDVRYILVGGTVPHYDALAEARQIGVASQVTLTGRVSAADFLLHAFASDMCLNLRYPSAGETVAIRPPIMMVPELATLPITLTAIRMSTTDIHT